MLDTNVGGMFNMTRAVVPHMISRRAGKIINLSSVSGEKGGRGQTNYAASKGAINAFTRSLAVELASRKITVNAVAPGVIETEMSRAVRELAGRRGEIADSPPPLRPAGGHRPRGLVSGVATMPITSPARSCTWTADSRWNEAHEQHRNNQGGDQAVFPKVAEIIADALGCDPEEVSSTSSLIEDLDAESIDFLDIVFRLERAFKVKIPRGKIVEDARGDLSEAEFEQKGVVTEAGLARLKAFLSEVPAERIQAPLKSADMPRLFTTETFCKMVVRPQKAAA